MALTLTAAISADAVEFVVTGTVPTTIGPDYRFRIGDELLRLQGFGPDTSIRGDYARQWAPRDRNRWLVQRGVDSTPASHAQGADIFAANDVFASSDDLTPPNPFTESPGGSGIPQGGPLTEDLDADGSKVIGLADPSDDQDAATKAYVDANAGAGAILTATVNLTAEDIATLSSVPVEVVAAPGAGKVIVPVSAAFQYKAGVVAFDTDQVVSVSLVGGAIYIDTAVAVPFSGTESSVTVLRSTGSMGTQAESANAALLVKCFDGEPDGAGDGTASLTVLYWVMDLA